MSQLWDLTVTLSYRIFWDYWYWWAIVSALAWRCVYLEWRLDRSVKK